MTSTTTPPRPSADQFPINFATLVRSSNNNDYLVLPVGFDSAARPDARIEPFAADLEAVRAAWRRLIADEPRTKRINEDAKFGQVQYVVRTAVFRFPDFVWFKPITMEDGATGVAIYCRRRYGVTDFGANRRRVERWLEALHQTVHAGS